MLPVLSDHFPVLHGDEALATWQVYKERCVCVSQHNISVVPK